MWAMVHRIRAHVRLPSTRALTAAAAALLALPQPAWSANKDIERVQVQIIGLQGQISDLARALDDTLREVRRLNESLAEQNALLRKSVQDTHMDNEALRASLKESSDRLGESLERLQQRVAALGGRPTLDAAAPADAGGVPGTAASAPTPADAGALPAPRELYSQAYADYARGNYDLAIQGFQEYLRTSPGSDLSDNAQYWIGECLYSKQKFPEAIQAWDDLFRKYPSSDKLPDARFKKGLALERLGRRREAAVEYRFVVDRYPNTEAARKAREKIGTP